MTMRLTLRMPATALALWAGLWLATGDTLAPVRAGLYLAPFVLALSGLLAVLGLVVRDWPVAAVAGLVALLIGAASPASLTRLPPPAHPGGITLTTLSNRTLNRDMVATAEMLRRHPADILVLQEVADPPRLTALLTGLYHAGRPPRACSLGTYLVLSRFPLGRPERLADNIAVVCPVRLPAGPAAIYSVHLPRALTRRDRQSRAVRALVAHAARQAVPAMIAGDFNATPLTTTLRIAGEHFANAFDAAGSGPGFTFPTPARRMGRLGPFLRIDHVLLAQVFQPRAARAAGWHPPGADHFPVEITFTDLRRAGGA